MKSSARANTSETQKQKAADASTADVLMLGTPGDDCTPRDAQGSSISAGDAQSAKTPATKGAAKPTKTPLTNNTKCTASGNGGKHPDREDRPTVPDQQPRRGPKSKASKKKSPFQKASSTYSNFIRIDHKRWVEPCPILDGATPREQAIADCGLAPDATHACLACKCWFEARHVGLSKWLLEAPSSSGANSSAASPPLAPSILRPHVIVVNSTGPAPSSAAADSIGAVKHAEAQRDAAESRARTAESERDEAQAAQDEAEAKAIALQLELNELDEQRHVELNRIYAKHAIELTELREQLTAAQFAVPVCKSAQVTELRKIIVRQCAELETKKRHIKDLQREASKNR